MSSGSAIPCTAIRDLPFVHKRIVCYPLCTGHMKHLEERLALNGAWGSPKSLKIKSWAEKRHVFRPTFLVLLLLLANGVSVITSHLAGIGFRVIHSLNFYYTPIHYLPICNDLGRYGHISTNHFQTKQNVNVLIVFADHRYDGAVVARIIGTMVR
ncbi:hypothetical protein [Paenibacillus taiwanensis]|uniref:hypothetical protein n=1 Tax=Paenibacillus taiwanensis TaxID=401638 RepID=UPI001B7FEBC9|nr:hypothetical protein [Paenibacillus taiwanensis]